jgi:hypothetical protein
LILFYLGNKTLNQKNPSDEPSKKSRGSPRDRSVVVGGGGDEIVEQHSRVRKYFYLNVS